jgi:hypothetical protein
MERTISTKDLKAKLGRRKVCDAIFQWTIAHVTDLIFSRRSGVYFSSFTRVLLSVSDDANDHNLLQKGALL